MTEAEWLGCPEPLTMFDQVRSNFSQRKHRLLACAACYRCWSYLACDCQEALRVIEQSADSLASTTDLAVAQRRSTSAMQCAEDEAVYFAAEEDARAWAREAILAAAGKEIIFGWPGRYETDHAAHYRELAVTANFIRDIFGNPFRPVVFSPSWRTDTAIALARQMYDSREFSAMPILADALQDAGCDNTDILLHCRDAGATHVRGCWVVDLVVGKE